MADVPLQRIEEIFQAAADLPPEMRPAFLDQHCAKDLPLRQELDALLALHSEPAADFITRGPYPDTDLPERIGRYRIIRLLGEGGMGAVYEAEQDNPLRNVALKVIRPGLLSRAFSARFQREAQLLARLHHPGIAQIFDAGSLDTGHGPSPYIAMELIRGEPLDAYASAHALSRRQRLALVAQICDAVQHAHECGVLHRDLKPANILVEVSNESESGARPRILDFGIARDTDANTLTDPTQTGQLLGTLPYMSPEQVSGTAVDARSDVYALGVILFEILSGRHPHDLRQRPIPEAARIIRDHEPTRLASLDTLLRGDVDTIAAKAIDKDPSRRYPSAAALAADIRRHLADQPITARPPSAIYQLGKFARRHRALVAATAAIFITLVAALAVSTTMYLRAEHARAGEAAQARIAGDRLAESQKARSASDRDAALSTAVVDYFISDILGAAAPQRDGPDVKVFDVLNRAADGIGDRFVDRPEVEARIRIELANAYNNLGDAPRAETHARRALALLAPRVEPGNELILRATFNLCAALQTQHKLQEQADIAAAALKAAGGLVKGDLTRIRLAAALGKALHALNRHEEAQDILRQALDSQPDDDTASMLRTDLIASLSAQDKLDQALPLAADLLEQDRRTLGPAQPATLAALNNYVNLLIRTKHYAKAAAAAADLPTLVERAFPAGHPARGYSNLTLATALLLADRPAEGDAPIHKSIEAFRARSEHSWELERCYTTLCEIDSALARAPELEQHSLQLLTERLLLAGPDEAQSLTSALADARLRFTKAHLPVPDLPALLLAGRAQLAPPDQLVRFDTNLAKLTEAAGPR